MEHMSVYHEVNNKGPDAEFANSVDLSKYPITMQNNSHQNFASTSGQAQQCSSENKKEERQVKRKLNLIDFFSGEMKKSPRLATEQATVRSVCNFKEGNKEDITLQIGLGAAVNENEKGKSVLNETVKNLKNELIEAKTQLHQARQENNKLTSALNELGQANNRLTSANNRLSSALNKVGQDNNRLTSALNKAGQENNRLTSALSEVNRNYKTLYNNYMMLKTRRNLIRPLNFIKPTAT